MTAALIERVVETAVFRPRGRFRELAYDHVPFDQLTGTQSYESVVLSALQAGDPVGIVGPRGGGKSSLIAHTCAGLPESLIALRVPVTGADDPTDVSNVAAVALGQALDAIEFERGQQREIERARSDQEVNERLPGGVRGGTLGGGPIPAQVHAELESLRQEFTTNRLGSERLAGLERLIGILVSRDLEPVFVLEDTEAAIGGADQTDLAEAFLSGPVRAFVEQVEAPCLIAIQTVFSSCSSFSDLAAQMRTIEIPRLGDGAIRNALNAIIENRLEQNELGGTGGEVIDDSALEQLIGFYDETGQSIRLTLAALQTAAEHAADMNAELIAAGHTRAAVADWRESQID